MANGLLACFLLLFILTVWSSMTCGYETKGNVASTADFSQGDIELEASLAVDGVRRTRGGKACARLTGDNPELHITLRDRYRVRFVVIYNDMTGALANEMQGFKVSVDGQLCYQDNTREGDMAEMVSAVCQEPILGERVTISLEGTGRTLSVCEAEVYEESCDCLEGCESDQRECNSPCVSDNRCNRENVALGKMTKSSELEEVSGPSSVVVNGNTGTTYVTRQLTSDVMQQNCIESLPLANTSIPYRGEDAPWWEVDLGRVVPVSAVVIYRRNPYWLWQTGTVTAITVDGGGCAKYGPDSHHRFDAWRERLVVHCENVVRGRIVRIARLRATDAEEPFPLRLCEVQVWVCKPGLYSADCDGRCGHCEGGRAICDGLSGECPNGCAAGWYSPLCQQRCLASRCKDDRCNQVTGLCDQCQGNWSPPQCEECQAGWYGSSCSELCGRCADDAPCDLITGNCTKGCQAGWAPPLCTSKTSTTEESRHSGAVAGAVVGSLFGIVFVVGAVIFVVIIIRRRRGGLKPNNLQPPHNLKPVISKPEAAKTDSNFSYVDAKSAATRVHSNTSDKHGHYVNAASDENRCNGIVASDKHGYNVNESAYESLATYQNATSDDHVYTMPVFNRQDSQTSSASGAYVNMHVNTDEETGGMQNAG